MFQGLRTVIYHVSDLEKARQWYSEALGIKPYFDQPFYVGFNVGGFELGLDPDPGEDGEGIGGSVAYWGVSNADEAFARLLELGASVHRVVREVGDDIRVAAVRDPFGNVLGIIENLHFKIEAAR
jgi:catechol 2,3-dioxygenase-like lactoylglutathione lyase family enzyme